ncbi:hypothetical protein [Citrobacter portucalensis]|uniref:hypothetical protein n=1 Tax=Citrobacter portucalensis TaxID=1639133 RepID=UPI002550D751|nr:hypothetical protein [Citrobacter portucalensis]
MILEVLFITALVGAIGGGVIGGLCGFGYSIIYDYPVLDTMLNGGLKGVEIGLPVVIVLVVIGNIISAMK